MSSKLLKISKIFTLLAFVLIGIEGCLNPNQKQGSCTQCPDYLVFVEGQCKSKKGCEQVMVRDKQVVCLACHNGYVLKNQKCLRTAQAKLQDNIPFNMTETAPLVAENVTKLTLQNITSNASSVPAPAAPVPAPVFKMPTFPEITIIPRTGQLSTLVRKQILEQYPHLFNYKLVQIGQQNSNTKRLLAYEDGTILLVTFPTSNTASNTANNTAVIEELVKGSNGDIVNKIKSKGAIVSSSLNINYKIANSNSQSYIVSSDMSTKCPQLLQSCSSAASQCSQLKPLVQQLDPRQNYSKYLKWSFDQQQKVIISLNLPDKVTKVEAEKKTVNIDSNQNLNKSGEEIKFKIYYVWDQDQQSEEEIMVINYFVDANTSAFTGYFSGGLDIFKELGIRQQESLPSNASKPNATISNPTTATPATPTTTVNTPAPTSTTTNINSSAVNNSSPTQNTMIHNTSSVTQNTAASTGGSTSSSISASTANSGSISTLNKTSGVFGNQTTPTPAVTATNTTAPTASSTTTTTATNSLNKTVATNATTNVFSNTTSSTVLTTNTTAGVFANTNTTNTTAKPALKPPILSAAEAKKAFNQDPNYGSNLNSSQVLQKKPSLSSQMPPKSVVTSPSIPLLSSSGELLNLLASSSQQFEFSLTNHYKTLQLTNQTCTSASDPSSLYQCYNLTILTEKQVLQITANESYRNNEVVAKYDTINDYSCWNSYQNVEQDSELLQGVPHQDHKMPGFEEAVGRQLDVHLRKTYPALKDFGSVYVQNKIDASGEKYYIVYVNKAWKRVIFYMQKNKQQQNNYILTSTQPFDNGYSLEPMGPTPLSEVQGQLLSAVPLQKKQSPLQKYRWELLSLFQNFKNYVQNAVLVCMLTNGTDVKMYISTKFANFQYLKKIGDRNNKGILIQIQFKNGLLLPIGWRVDDLIRDGSNDDDEVYRALRDLVINRYRSLFGGSAIEIFMQRYPGSRMYEVAIKTIMGLYTFKATQSPFKTFALTPMKKVQQAGEQKNVKKCKQNEKYDSNDNRCYQFIEGCFKQIGSYCIMCQPDFVLEAGKKLCRRNCNW